MTEEKKAYFIPLIIKELFMMFIGINNTLLSNVANRKKENWYLIRNIEVYNYPAFDIKHYLNEIDYQSAIDSLGVSESNMEHTDGTIPWSLHL